MVRARRSHSSRLEYSTSRYSSALRGREIAFVADPLDALVLQIQGSGRLRLQGSDGRVQTVRLAFAGHNDQPYASVGRWLINQGELKADGASRRSSLPSGVSSEITDS